jgi:hypothetical protein
MSCTEGAALVTAVGCVGKENLEKSVIGTSVLPCDMVEGA